MSDNIDGTPNRPATVFVELDALLDTRAGLLFNISKEKFEINVAKGLHKRTTDIFEGVSEHHYQELYSKRNKSVLVNSQVTPIGKLIGEFAKNVQNRNLNTPIRSDCEIVINMYPYVLEEKEQSEIILAVSKLTMDLANITAVFMRPEEITFEYIKKNIDALYIYNFADWFNANIDPLMAIKGRMCPGVAMICPSIAKTKKLNGYKHSEIFKQLAATYKPMIGVEFVDVENFTMVMAPVVQETIRKQKLASMTQP